MITRNSARKALAELQHRVPVPIQPAAAFVKPSQQSAERVTKKESTFEAAEQQSAEGVSIISKKMNVISLDSSCEEDDEPNSETDPIDLSESSEFVIDLSSSDDADDDQSDMSADEDREESDYSEDENRDQRKSSSASTVAHQLLATEVAKIIRGGDLKKLKLDDCKTYLRNYKLRVTGTKPVLIDRIKQHIELKEGGSRSYDRSTFNINCTGDVCKGDVVVFNQKVYNKKDKFCSTTPNRNSVTTQNATRARSRTVAGRVVKESYGAQRQQHTFTVEVLWSTGCRPLSPMKQLLVKGRNLYKRKAFRQKWADEGERQRTLDEKHERGAAARQIRAVKQRRFKGHQGNAGRFGLEGWSRTQLANPYTDTLASKESSNSGNVFQSAVSGHQLAAVVTRPHAPTGANSVPLGRIRQFGLHSETVEINEARVVRHHTQTGANSVPLGKIRQFGLHSESVEINEARVVHHHTQTGANTVPLGRIRQFGLPAENGEINEARVVHHHSQTGANTVPLGRIRQFELPSENGETKDPSGGATTSVNNHRQWFKPAHVRFPCDRDAHKQQPCEAQNISSVPKLQGGSSGSQSGLRNLTQSVSRQAPITISVCNGAGTTSRRTQSHNGKSTSSLNTPSSALLGRSVSPFPNRPCSPSLRRPASPVPNRPSSPPLGRPVPPFSGKPYDRNGLGASSSLNRPSSPSLGRPMSPFPNGHSSPYLGRPISPLSNRPSSPSLGRPVSPFPNRHSSTSLGRTLSPFPNRPAVNDGILGSASSSPLLDRHGSQSLLHRPSSPKLTSSDNGFPCPTASCTYRKSRYCSNGVCYYCCKKKRGLCSNPRHLSKSGTIQRESSRGERFHMLKVHQSYGQYSP